MFELMEKARNKKGFTLMEMLIVVAIIAILVAIIIPVFSSQLDKAKLATDSANIRSAYAMMQTCNLLGTDPTGADEADGVWWLQKNGSFVKAGTSGAYVLQISADATVAAKNCPSYGTAWTAGQGICITCATGAWTLSTGSL